MRLHEFISEGGWANVSTQGTIITPQTIANTIPVMKQFERSLNKFLNKNGEIPPIKIGNPVGSGTYYKRDLKDNPDKEYGDIDVQFIIPRIEGQTLNQIQSMYFDAVTEFCRINAAFETVSGKNVIFQIGTDFIQVDLVAIMSDRVEFTKALAPEHGTKGVLSGSLYSAFAQALDISISDAGVQGKTIDGKLVKYSKRKGTVLNLISQSNSNWAMDIVKFLGAKKASPMLKQNPGMKEEVKIQDIINSFNGIATTLELNQLLSRHVSAEELLQDTKNIYIKKINAVINSSKFDKASDASSKKKAQDTKNMLAKRSQEIAALL